MNQITHSRNIITELNGTGLFLESVVYDLLIKNSGKLCRNQGERPYLALRQANEAISSFYEFPLPYSLRTRTQGGLVRLDALHLLYQQKNVKNLSRN